MSRIIFDTHPLPRYLVMTAEGGSSVYSEAGEFESSEEAIAAAEGFAADGLRAMVIDREGSE